MGRQSVGTDRNLVTVRQRHRWRNRCYGETVRTTPATRAPGSENLPNLERPMNVDERNERPRTLLWLGPTLLTAAIALCACGGCDRSDEAEEGAQATAEPAESAGSFGTVEGVVRIVAGAELPSYPDLRAPTQPPPPEACTPPRTVDRQPVQMNDARLLSGVLVQASGFTQEVTREPVTHEAFIRDCRLTPQLIAAVRGDTLTLKNETDYPFLPTMGLSNLSTAVLHDESRDYPLDRGGIFNLTCGFAAPCGRADVVVVYHPVHDITEEGGTFRMENVPAGEELRIHAWHPLFQEAAQTVTVAEGETLRIELELTPAPQPEPPAEPTGDEPTGPPEDQPGLF